MCIPMATTFWGVAVLALAVAILAAAVMRRR